MNKFVKRKIATSLILGQLITSNMCFAGNNTSKTWQEKSIEKLQSFAREIKSSMKADPGWWVGGTSVAVGTILFGGYLLFNNRMSLKFVEQYKKLKNDISSGQINGVKTTISSSDFSNVLSAATECLKKDDIVININTNGDRLLIASDIHGDFESLSLVIDEFLKDPDNTKLLFLGDYVDRGDYSVEVLYTLALLKICYSDRVFLLRGNHDTQGQREMDHPYVTEFNSKFSSSATKCIDARTGFDSCLSLVAIVDDKFVCTHAGFGPSGTIDWARQQKKPLKYDIDSRTNSTYTYNRPLEELLIIRADKSLDSTYMDTYDCGVVDKYGVSSLDGIVKDNLKCLIHGHNHENTRTFGNPREICVCTNPINWSYRFGPRVIRNLPVGLIEIQNNRLELRTYTYPSLEKSSQAGITHDYN
ncbi:MAG: serine/threonine protein phosphatase [Clostridia bacterium]|nr:serine/threonine protein phosphatase [Clostridia bacterium]